MSILRITSPATLSSACAMSCIIWCVALSHRTHMVFSNLLRITNGLYFGVYQVCACNTFSQPVIHQHAYILCYICNMISQRGEHMKTKNVKVFDQDDIDFMTCLQDIGVERRQAAVLAFFRVEEVGTSRDIEVTAMIRQPEVSIAISTLRKLGFINAEQLVVPGKKGQYNNEYSLAVPLSDIIDHFWQIKLKEWGDMMDNYKKLSEYEIRPFSG